MNIKEILESIDNDTLESDVREKLESIESEFDQVDFINDIGRTLTGLSEARIIAPFTTVGGPNLLRLPMWNEVRRIQ